VLISIYRAILPLVWIALIKYLPIEINFERLSFWRRYYVLKTYDYISVLYAMVSLKTVLSTVQN